MRIGHTNATCVPLPIQEGKTMQGTLRMDNVREVNVLKVTKWKTKHIFVNDGDTNIELVLTYELAEILRKKLGE